MNKTYAVSDDEFRLIVSKANCISDILRALGLRTEHGPSYPVIRKRIAALDISTSHFDPSRYVKKAIAANKRPLAEILVVDSTVGSSGLRKRLVKEGVLKHECVKCGNKGEWLGSPLTLQLDHENGNHRDNRLDNLRILCPNCHTQTPTHSSGHLKRPKKRYFCADCRTEVSKQSTRCRKCNDLYLISIQHPSKVPKIVWPCKEELASMVWKEPMVKLAATLHVSTTSIRDRCLAEKIQWPPQSYWARRRVGQTHEQALMVKVIRPKRIINRLTSLQLEQIRGRLAIGEKCRVIGRAMNLYHQLISDIKLGKQYR